jgi:hypothetical protein
VQSLVASIRVPPPEQAESVLEYWRANRANSHVMPFFRSAIGRYLDFLCDMSTFELEAYVREPQRAFSDMTKARNKGGNYVIDPRFVHFVGMPQGEALMRRLDRETKPGGPARSLSFNTAHMHPQPTDVARSMSAKIDKRYAAARRDMGEAALGHYVFTGEAMPCWVWNETLGCWEYVEPMSAIIGVGLMLQVGWLGPMTRKLEARENQACYTLMCLTTRALECQREHVQRTLAAGYTRLVDFAHTMYLGLRQPRILALKFSILYQIGDVEESMAIYKRAGVSRLLRRAAMSNYAKKHIMHRISMGQDLWTSLAARTNGGGLCVRTPLSCHVGKVPLSPLTRKCPSPPFF